MAIAQWRGRARRSAALLATIAVAVTSFTLLTAAATTSRLDAVGAVTANYRPAYDILVRPRGSQLPLERRANLVQSGQISAMRGGITLAQWRDLQAMPEIAVAAPVAVVGYIMRTVPLPVDLSGHLDADTERQVLRVRPTWVTDTGLSRIPDGPAYLYKTAHDLRQPDYDRRYGFDELVGPEELDGRPGKVCASSGKFGIDPLAPAARSSLSCVGGPGARDWTGRPVEPVVTLAWTVPFLLAAVDPAAEAALAGLDRAVTSGRYLTPRDGAVPRVLTEDPPRDPPTGYTALPFLMADRPQVDAGLELGIERLDASAADLVRREPDSSRVRAELADRPGTPLETRRVALDGVYRTLVQRLRGEGPSTNLVGDSFNDDRFLSTYWSVGAVRATERGNGLRTELTPQDPKLWGVGSDFGDSAHGVPMEFADTGVRDPVGVHANKPLPRPADPDNQMPDVAAEVVGTFDPSKVNLGGALSAVPMDTYFNPGAPGADAASRRALRDRPLQPTANVTGPLSQPPLMLTTIDAAGVLVNRDRYTTRPDYPELQLPQAAPISVVRIRLAGDVGIDPVSREKVRLVAQRIAGRTGLQVDITLGSSPTRVAVEYPAGRFGRPGLTVAEPWVRKGVAAVLVTAIDRKSLLLSALVLAVCALAVVNATAAATRSRRTELGVLACLGWPRRRLLGLLLSEVAGIGILAGVLGAVAALPLGLLLGLEMPAGHLLAAVPVALALTLAAGAWPAWRSSRSDPAAAVRTAASTSAGRGRPPRRLTTLALANLARTPARTLLGAGSLAIGVAALTMLLGVTFAFRGQVTGTLLGEAISFQARTVDHLAVAVTVALGVVSVADVLYLNLSERANELALLQAVGWTDAHVGRLVAVEAAGIGVLGGMLGAATGLGATAAFAGDVTTGLVWSAAAAGTGGLAVGMAAAAVPLVMLRRLPTAQLLAQE